MLKSLMKSMGFIGEKKNDDRTEYTIVVKYNDAGRPSISGRFKWHWDVLDANGLRIMSGDSRKEKDAFKDARDSLKRRAKTEQLLATPVKKMKVRI